MKKGSIIWRHRSVESCRQGNGKPVEFVLLGGTDCKLVMPARTVRKSCPVDRVFAMCRKSLRLWCHRQDSKWQGFEPSLGILLAAGTGLHVMLPCFTTPLWDACATSSASSVAYFLLWAIVEKKKRKTRKATRAI